VAGITLAISIRDAGFVARRAVIAVKDVANSFRSLAHPSAHVRVSLAV
jgi:hypothetical protein